jgi:hypothetical protein
MHWIFLKDKRAIMIARHRILLFDKSYFCKCEGRVGERMAAAESKHRSIAVTYTRERTKRREAGEGKGWRVE